MSFTTRNTALLAAVLLSATTMAGDIQQVSAKETGCGSVNCGEAACCQEGCNAKTKNVRCKDCRNKKSNGQACQSCQSCNSCDACDSTAGKCSMRNRMDAFALDWAGKCGPIGRRAAKGRPLAQKLHWHCTTKASPDSGWAPPTTMPVTRTGGSYTAYNNFGMGGYAPAAPMVYQPTDTTQMGYSYANVPRWRPNPNMIPAVPIPSNFHARFCPTQSGGTSSCQSGQCNMRSMSQEIYYEPASSSCPSCNLSSTGQPVRQQVVAAPTPTRTAVSVPAKPAALKPAVTRVRAITPPPILMEQTSVSPKTQVKQVSQQRTVSPSNQMAQQRVRPSNNYRRPQQQKSTGWFGLPSLREIQF